MGLLRYIGKAQVVNEYSPIFVDKIKYFALRKNPTEVLRPRSHIENRDEFRVEIIEDPRIIRLVSSKYREQKQNQKP